MKQTVRVIVLEIVAVLLLVVLTAAGLLAWRLAQGPLDLEFIRPQIEASLTRARGGAKVTLGRVMLEWSRQSGRIQAAANELTAYGPNRSTDASNVLFRAERAVLTIDAASLLAGSIKARRIRLESGRATIIRSAEGVWRLADIVILREPKPGERPFDPLRDLNWSTLATPLRAGLDAGAFEAVDLANFRFDVVDRKFGSIWAADPVAGSWRADREQGVKLSLSMTLSGGAGANAVQLDLSSNPAVTEATGSLGLEGVDPLILARMFGYKGDAFATDKPANASFDLAGTEAAGLTRAGLSLSDVSGRMAINGFDAAIRDLSLEASYDPATKQLDLKRLAVDSDRASGEVAIRFDVEQLMAGAVTAPIPVELAAKNLMLDLQPFFASPWRFADVRLKGAVSPSQLRLDFTDLEIATGTFNAKSSGAIWLDTAEGRIRPAAKLSATGEGALSPGEVAAFWPARLGAGARQWLVDRVPAGRVTRATFRLDWPPGANAQGFLPDERLSLDFEAADATIIYLEGFPPLTGVAGKGRLQGNSLNMQVSAATLGGWRADGGEVSFPRFHPKDDFLTVRVTGRGGLRDMMKILDASPLQAGQRYGLAVDAMQGEGSVLVELRRPMETTDPDGDVDYRISGRFEKAVAPALLGEYGLSEAAVDYVVDAETLKFTGTGRFGPAPVSFTWTETLGGTVGRSQLKAKGQLTPTVLNGIGFAARSLMQGEAEVELAAEGSGRSFEAIRADVDFTRAAISLPELGWAKKAGAPARGVFRYGADETGGAIAGDILADGIELSGDGLINAEGQLAKADIDHLFSRGHMDLKGSVLRTPAGGYRINLSGPIFDARPWVDGLFSMSGDGGAKTPPQVGAKPQPMWELNLSADRMRLRDDEELREAEVRLELGAGGPRSGAVRGKIADGKMLSVDIEPDDGPGAESSVRRIRLRSDDAGFGARVLLKTDDLSGGTLAIDGRMDGGRMNATAVLTDVRLRQAPLLAQLLSLASLRGLTDVLSGDGVLFTRIESPFSISGGRIEFPGLRASGPAMGLTARGWIEPNKGELSLDGVLVPSFGVNSALGGIPIIGDLFVSRQGEGLFAPTYSVRGTFSRARVSVNPISAVTPGVLRRIFEVPGDPSPAISVEGQ